MMKKIVIGFVLVLMISMIGVASANVVSSSDKEFYSPEYTSKYAPPPDAAKAPTQFAGHVFIHSPSSPLTQVTNDHDYWPPEPVFYNTKAKDRSVVLTFGDDGTFDDYYGAGDYMIEYRYCKIPVAVENGINTVVALPVCDR